MKPLLAAEIFLFFFFLKASSSLPLQFLLVSETGVEREFLIVADAPELGVRVLGVAELESGGLLFCFFTMTVDGKQGERQMSALSLSLSLSLAFRVSCVFPLEAQQTAQSARHTHARTSAQRDPVRLSGGCMQPRGKSKENGKKAKE